MAVSVMMVRGGLMLLMLMLLLGLMMVVLMVGGRRVPRTGPRMHDRIVIRIDRCGPSKRHGGGIDHHQIDRSREIDVGYVCVCVCELCGNLMCIRCMGIMGQGLRRQYAESCRKWRRKRTWSNGIEDDRQTERGERDRERKRRFRDSGLVAVLNITNLRLQY